jgi:hypothetical protein
MPVGELQGIIDFVGKIGGWGVGILVAWAVWSGRLLLPRERVSLIEAHEREVKSLNERLRESEDREKKWETLALQGTRIAGLATTMAREASAAAATQPPAPPPAA